MPITNDLSDLINAQINLGGGLPPEPLVVGRNQWKAAHYQYLGNSDDVLTTFTGYNNYLAANIVGTDRSTIAFDAAGVTTALTYYPFKSPSRTPFLAVMRIGQWQGALPASGKLNLRRGRFIPAGNRYYKQVWKRNSPTSSNKKWDSATITEVPCTPNIPIVFEAPAIDGELWAIADEITDLPGNYIYGGAGTDELALRALLATGVHRANLRAIKGALLSSVSVTDGPLADANEVAAVAFALKHNWVNVRMLLAKR